MKEQCINGRMSDPSDCNGCHCVNEGGSTKLLMCTKAGCPTEQRNSGEFCNLILNNCVDGFACQKAKDVWEDKLYGRCVKL